MFTLFSLIHRYIYSSFSFTVCILSLNFCFIILDWGPLVIQLKYCPVLPSLKLIIIIIIIIIINTRNREPGSGIGFTCKTSTPPGKPLSFDHHLCPGRGVARIFQRGGGHHPGIADYIWFIPLLSLVYQRDQSYYRGIKSPY